MNLSVKTFDDIMLVILPYIHNLKNGSNGEVVVKVWKKVWIVWITLEYLFLSI